MIHSALFAGPVAPPCPRLSDVLRLPRRGLRPRLRYQRQLALAFHLYSDFDEARRVLLIGHGQAGLSHVDDNPPFFDMKL